MYKALVGHNLEVCKIMLYDTDHTGAICSVWQSIRNHSIIRNIQYSNKQELQLAVFIQFV